MTVSKISIPKYSKKQLNQLQYLKAMMEGREAKVSSTAFRHHILEKQKLRNYSSEYERIRAHLEDTALPFQSRQQLKDRTEHLKTLGARAFVIA